MFCNCKKIEEKLKSLIKEIEVMQSQLWKQGIVPVRQHFHPVDESNLRSNIQMILDYLGVEIISKEATREIIKKSEKEKL